MQTIKLPYKTNIDFLNIISDIQKQYSNCLHFMFNRLVKNKLSETEIKHLNINGTDLLDSWFKQSCIKEAIQINNKNIDNKVYFGGKKNYFKRLENKITKEEFKELKLSAIYSIGEGSNPGVGANRKFHIEHDLSSITFKPNRKIKIKLELPKLSLNYKKIFTILYQKQENRTTQITYKLDKKYIYLSFDEKDISNNIIKYDHISDRILAIDLNPNYIGYSIVDWKNDHEYNIINSGVFSIKQLNDIEKQFKNKKLSSNSNERINLNNKRKYETFQISKKLINLCLHYKIEIFSFEKLGIKSKDNKKGKNYNKLVNNNWLKNDLINNLKKNCNIHKIKYIEVKPEYSSFIGNLSYRQSRLPDMILSSIEIGRRGYEFNLQYIKKIKNKEKNIIFPNINIFKEFVVKSLEEINNKLEFNTWIELYKQIKNSDIKYRVQLETLDYLNCFSQKHKSLIEILYGFN